MPFKTKLFFLSVCSFFSLRAWAASCCGGGFAAPSLIVGDDKAMVSLSYGYSRIMDDVGADSFWRRRDSREVGETYKVEAAHILSDRWQAGLSVPVVERSLSGSHSTGLGDIAGTLGYEYLPEWEYSAWRPRGLGFLQLTLPTGKSINEADSTYQLDSRGRGFWALGLGTILTKVIAEWDVFLNFDVHRSFNKTYGNSQSAGALKPGFGGNLGLGGGYNLGDWRFGGALTWTYEDPVDVSGTISSQGAAQRYATGTLSLSYIFLEDWTATVSYADQTLFGDPTNTSLGRGIVLMVQKRWPR